MYAINTWLIILGCVIKPCIIGIHMHSEMNMSFTFGNHGMDGKDTPIFLIEKVNF